MFHPSQTNENWTMTINQNPGSRVRRRRRMKTMMKMRMLRPWWYVSIAFNCPLRTGVMIYLIIMDIRISRLSWISHSMPVESVEIVSNPKDEDDASEEKVETKKSKTEGVVQTRSMSRGSMSPKGTWKFKKNLHNMRIFEYICLCVCLSIRSPL